MKIDWAIIGEIFEEKQKKKIATRESTGLVELNDTERQFCLDSVRNVRGSCFSKVYIFFHTHILGIFFIFCYVSFQFNVCVRLANITFYKSWKNILCFYSIGRKNVVIFFLDYISL